MRARLKVIDYDLFEGQIAQAHTAFPRRRLGGIASRNSIIHIVPSLLNELFTQWMRVLEPEAPVLVSFFGSLSADTQGTPFHHRVPTAERAAFTPSAATHDHLVRTNFADVVRMLPLDTASTYRCRGTAPYSPWVA